MSVMLTPTHFMRSSRYLKTPEISISANYPHPLTRCMGSHPHSRVFFKNQRQWFHSCYDKVASNLVFDNSRMLETGFKPRHTLQSVFFEKKMIYSFLMTFLIYLSSIVLGSLGAWFISRHAHLLGLIDCPSERSSHDRPTPKGGGVGILAAFILACLLNQIPTLVWLPITLLSLLSLYGDRINLKPGLRLSVQFGSVFLVLSAIDISFINLANGNHPFLRLLLTHIFCAVFVVGTANFYNFMDGINGIAGITGIVGFGLVGVFGLLTEQSPQWVTLAFVMAFSCCGFLPFNILIARVFMGDVEHIAWVCLCLHGCGIYPNLFRLCHSGFFYVPFLY